VFVEDPHGDRFMATVTALDGDTGQYTLTRRRPSGLNGEGGEMGRGPWTNATLPTCGICEKDKASVALSCSCAAPSTCPCCARRLPECPRCGEVLSTRYDMTLSPNIFALSPSPKPFEIMIKTFSDKYEVLRVCDDWCVKTVAALYGKRTGIWPIRLRFIYGGRALASDYTLARYEIKHGCVVHMVEALRGD